MSFYPIFSYLDLLIVNKKVFNDMFLKSSFQVSYVSMLDIWMVMCIFFIFLVLIEFAVVTSLIRRHQKPTAEKIEDFGTYGLPILFGTFNVIYWFTLFFTWNSNLLYTFPKKSLYIIDNYLFHDSGSQWTNRYSEYNKNLNVMD